MRSLRALLLRVGGLFRKAQYDTDLSSELESHLRMHIEENLRAGMSPEEARRQALIKLGGVEQTKEMVRERRGLPILEIVLRDLRFGARMLVKNAGFTLVAVFTLALGIGATTAIFSVVYGVLLRPLPYPKPDQIFQLWEVNAKGNRVNFTEPNFSDMRSTSRSLKGLGECNAGPFTITGDSEPGCSGLPGFLQGDGCFTALRSWFQCRRSTRGRRAGAVDQPWLLAAIL